MYYRMGSSSTTSNASNTWTLTPSFRNTYVFPGKEAKVTQATQAPHAAQPALPQVDMRPSWPPIELKFWKPRFVPHYYLQLVSGLYEERWKDRAYNFQYLVSNISYVSDYFFNKPALIQNAAVLHIRVEKYKRAVYAHEGIPDFRILASSAHWESLLLGKQMFAHFLGNPPKEQIQAGLNMLAELIDEFRQHGSHPPSIRR